MATLVSRINDLAVEIRNKFNSVLNSLRPSSIVFVIDGGGAAITTGVKGDIQIPFGCTITSWTLLADQVGSITLDLWKVPYASYPPSSTFSITALSKPTLSAAEKSQDATLSNWLKAISAGDIIRINVNSATTVQRVTLQLNVQRS